MDPNNEDACPICGDASGNCQTWSCIDPGCKVIFDRPSCRESEDAYCFKCYEASIRDD